MILFDPDRTKLSAALLKQAKEPVRLPSARLLDEFLAAAQKAARLKGEVSVMISTDAAIRRLNREYRGKDKATDVLSFPAEGVGAEGLAGDLMISAPTALRQARKQKHTLATEMKVLLLHGVLHLAGHDHETDEGQMAKLEQKLRARLGLPQGLIERVEEKSVASKKPVAAKTSAVKKAAPKKAAGKTVAAKSAAKTSAVKRVARKSVPAKVSAEVEVAQAAAVKPMRRACGTGKKAVAKRGTKR